jgi:predicted PurR-regulated permease PerM
MWFKGKFFKYGAAILLTLLIIFFIGQVDFFLVPFKMFIGTLFFPILIALLLYYLMRPLVNIVEKLHVPRSFAIIIIFLLTFLLIIFIGTYAGSLIGDQLNGLIKDLPGIVQSANNRIYDILRSDEFRTNFGSLSDKIQQQLANYAQSLIPILSKSLFGVFSTVTSIVTVVVVVPFILFYLLKDDKYFVTLLMRWLPARYKKDIVHILKEVDNTLSIYIIGQGMIALILAILMYIGYLVIGLKYAFVLAIFAMITFFIPIFGSIIGILPALLISLAVSPFMAVKILVLMVIVQQLEGNLISPQLMGKRLDIHPLTLILLFLVAASLYGFIGMLIAVPTYAVLKVIVSSIIRIYRVYKANSFSKDKGI